MYPMAIGFFNVGEKVPDVTLPISLDPSLLYIMDPSRAGAFIPVMPIRLRSTVRNLPSGVKTCAAPKNPCSTRRRLPGGPNVQPNAASMGVV